jgi:hypothetical protein
MPLVAPQRGSPRRRPPSPDAPEASQGRSPGWSPRSEPSSGPPDPMSAFLPAPLTIVVFSLSIITLLGATEHVERDVLQFDAEIFRDRLAKETQFSTISIVPALPLRSDQPADPAQSRHRMSCTARCACPCRVRQPSKRSTRSSPYCQTCGSPARQLAGAC